MSSNPLNAAKLGSVKTELLIALIFEVLVVIGYLAMFGMVAIGASLFASVAGEEGAGLFAGIGMIFAVIVLIPLIVSIFVLRRTMKMRGAANSGDVATLKSLNSMGWAIIALLFTGLIPGILLIIAHGPIGELSTTS